MFAIGRNMQAIAETLRTVRAASDKERMQAAAQFARAMAKGSSIYNGANADA